MQLPGGNGEVCHETVCVHDFILYCHLCFLATSAFCQKLRPVTIGLTGKSLATAAFEMSIRKGHFKQEGLDVKFITIRQSDVIIKAIMAGELNFMSIIPTAILASV